MTKSKQNLESIYLTLKDWCEEHDYEEEFDEFDELCDNIMADNQTYFQWEVDGDCFSIEDALDTVMSTLLDKQKEGKQIADYYIDYMFDDRLFLFVEYK